MGTCLRIKLSINIIYIGHTYSWGLGYPELLINCTFPDWDIFIFIFINFPYFLRRAPYRSARTKKKKKVHTQYKINTLSTKIGLHTNFL